MATNTPTTFADLIEHWGIALFASDISVPYATANAMKQRCSIPSKYWAAVASAGPKRGFNIDVEGLVKMQARSAQTKRTVAA